VIGGNSIAENILQYERQRLKRWKGGASASFVAVCSMLFNRGVRYTKLIVISHDSNSLCDNITCTIINITIILMKMLIY